MKTDLSIPTPDGEARAFVFTPDSGDGPWPAAILYMDAPAIRPAMFEMGERLAQAGYYVLLPDMFWRIGPYPPIDLAAVFKDEATRREVFSKFMGSTGPEKAMADTAGFLDWIEAQPQARSGKVGVTGYCMGGGFALRAAAAFPDRIGAAASFHGGNLATDADNSPHLKAADIKAKVLVAGADHDHGYPPEQDARLRDALTAAGVDADVSIWTGLKHGWVPTDMPVYDAAGAQKHWDALIELFDGALQ